MEGKVAVLGDADFVMPFSALGLDTFEVSDDAGDIAEKAEHILQSRYAMVAVAEPVAQKAQELFDKTEKKSTPCVIVVPFTQQAEGFATKQLGKLLKMATGINILQK